MAKETTTEPKPTKPASYGGDWVIRVLTKKNPKKEGSTAHLKFSLLQDGMTVSQFREAASKHDNLKGRVGLRWDIDHGYIRVENSKV